MTELDRAVSVLRSGGLVAFPTETVYGLGADATNATAVARIFAAKGRPSTNPLIVHVHDATVACRYATAWPDAAERLALHFWPGPLTLVVPRTRQIPPIVTAGLDTVGLRVPDHPLALQLLRAFDGPVAAPSANRSTRVSPTTAQHVRDELGDRVDLILDGGPCTVGIESTVLDLSGDRPTILRPGGVSRAQLEAIIGPVALAHGVVDPGRPAASPGQHSVHYAPQALAYRFEAEDAPRVESAALASPSPRALMAPQPLREDLTRLSWDRVVPMPADPRQYARQLYARLRALDASGVRCIFVQMPPESPEWYAVRDRLTRATRPMNSITR